LSYENAGVQCERFVIYRMLCILELILVLAIALLLLVPIQDYAMSEFKQHLRNPSEQTLSTFRDKTREESGLRQKIAVSLATAALVLSIPIVKLRRGRTL
jgi:hypothetical protein